MAKAAAPEEGIAEPVEKAEKVKKEKVKKEAQPRQGLVSQNGVTRPGKGSTLKIWEIADSISANKKAPADRKEVTEAALALNPPLKSGTVHTQYGRWRKFHGLTSMREVNRAEKAKEPKEPKVKKEKQAKNAEAEVATEA